RMRGEGLALPAAAALLSPWTDLSGSGDSMSTRAQEDPMVSPDRLRTMAGAYLGGASETDPLASPLFADLAGLPPMLVQVGTAEVLLDDSTRLARRAEAAGVEVRLETWEDMLHVFHAFPSLPEAGRAIDGIGAYLRQRWA
ncbi:MAG: alpha/beta hydrolase fold domain-containing protein, partial [Thermoanaerobaculia bacterium]|nr:alpha/beta hydrolase fold domain-containing protein [Thermoanaerobaculia bacterium]